VHTLYNAYQTHTTISTPKRDEKVTVNPFMQILFQAKRPNKLQHVLTAEHFSATIRLSACWCVHVFYVSLQLFNDLYSSLQ